MDFCTARHAAAGQTSRPDHVFCTCPINSSVWVSSRQKKYIYIFTTALQHLLLTVRNNTVTSTQMSGRPTIFCHLLPRFATWCLPHHVNLLVPHWSRSCKWKYQQQLHRAVAISCAITMQNKGPYLKELISVVSPAWPARESIAVLSLWWMSPTQDLTDLTNHDWRNGATFLPKSLFSASLAFLHCRSISTEDIQVAQPTHLH